MTIINKTCATVLALLTGAAPAWASGACPAPREMAALQTASIQQRLMVAALTCNDVPAYNRFVITYRSDLQQSDAALLSFFQHKRSGTAEYHSYKTHLANGSELDAIHDSAFCARADATFRSIADKPSLADVLASEYIPDTGFDGCYKREANAGVEPARATPSHDGTRW